MLLRTIWLSLDPYMRGRMNDGPSYAAPVPIGGVTPATAVLKLKPATVGGDIVLEVTGLSKYFGGLKAVDGVDIEVRRGGVHALIGPNGSGKTTTLNVLSGLYKATAGKIVLDGTDMTNMPPHQRTARAWDGRSRTSACSAR